MEQKKLSQHKVLRATWILFLFVVLAGLASSLAWGQQAPTFNQSEYHFTLDENADGSLFPVNVGRVNATDPENGSVTYSIDLSSINEEVLFEINPSTGIITYIGEGEDYDEGTQEYTLNVVARDNENKIATAEVIVNINNIDEVPVFNQSSYTFSLDENEENVPLGNVDAEDPENEHVEYLIISPNSLFSIETTNGDIRYTGNGENYETKNQYILTIVAYERDNNLSISTANVIINITDVNEAPEFNQSSYTFTLDENLDGSSNPVNVGKVKATDPDADSTLTYSITVGDTNKFNINSSNGEITYIGSGEDHETDNLYTLTVKVSDGKNEVDNRVNININNLNEIPAFSQNAYSFILRENSEGSTIPVDKVTATDPDDTDTITYSILLGDKNKFNISSETGDITYIGEGEDYESDIRGYFLIIKATDNNNATSNAIVNIKIEDDTSDDRILKFDRSKYVFNIDENLNGSSTSVDVGRVTAAGGTGSFTYAIQEGDTDKFAIDSGNGNITYIESGEDYESGDIQYNLLINVSDGENNVTTNVVIDINNLDENPLLFNKETYNFTLSENVNGSGTPVDVGSVTATNYNNDQVKYLSITTDTPFEINPSTGAITYTGSGEDYESVTKHYDLIIAAYRENNSSDVATTNIVINITDLNETPAFNQSSYTFSLDENADGSSTPVDVGSVSATDPETDTVTYYINDDTLFNIDSSTGVITYNGSGEDYESRTKQYSLEITAGDGLSNTTADFTININNIDETPVFKKDSYTFSINENVNASSNPVNIGTVEATDADENDNITYSISVGDTNKFNINSSAGVITYIGEGEDYETFPKNYSLIVSASDGVNRADIIVTVTIADLNDGGFRFESSSYIFSLDENLDGSEDPENVGRISTVNGVSSVTYSITRGNTNDKFSIGSDGIINYTGSGEDYESRTKRYTLTISANDGDKTITTNVVININNLNDEGEFGFEREVYVFFLEENANGVNIGNVSTNDVVVNGFDRYDIVGGDSNKFSIDSLTGAITYNGGGEDYESDTKQYNLQVNASYFNESNERNQVTTTVVVNIKDLDDNSLVFNQSSYTFTFDENLDGSSDPQDVGSVTAEIPISGTANGYLILSHTNLFNVTSGGNVVYIGEGENYESGTIQYDLTIVAYIDEDRSNAATANVVVNINNVNETPFFNQSSYTFTLDENLNGSLNPINVGGVKAADNDTNDVITYSFISGHGDLFNINSSNGEITYIGSGEDYERRTNPQYILTVRASDGINNADTDVDINITDLNEIPAFELKVYSSTLAENRDGSETPVDIRTVTATDPDGREDTITYSILLGDTNKFNISSENGQITYIGDGEDYERDIRNYVLVIKATDNKSSVNAIVKIELTDIQNDNEPLRFGETEYVFNIDENADESETPVSVGTVTAIEGAGSPTYAIHEGDTDKFDIDSRNGLITYIGYGEDYESGTIQYNLKINASDGEDYVIVNVVVDINDLNDNPLTFRQRMYNFNLSENDDGSSTPVDIGSVTATDYNNDQLIYFIISPNTKFVVDSATGDITYTGRGENYESEIKQHNLIIVAYLEDDNTSITSTNVEVNITDLNETPVFNQSSYTFTLDENLDGSSDPQDVGSVSATDPETDTITYSINEGTPFEIDSDGAITYTGSGEDYESETKQHDLKITASDGVRDATVDVTVKINNQDDNVLVFKESSYTFGVNENLNGSSNPVKVGTVEADDADGEDYNVTYSISVGDTNKFNINSSTGVITYIGEGEDYETPPSNYTLIVIGSDTQTTDNTIVTIVIRDVKDQGFRFEELEYAFNIDENVDGSTTPVNIGNAKAIEGSGTPTYSISEGDTNKFRINSRNGNITYIGSGEDHESETKQYNLTIMAKDGTDNATVKVVVNINDLYDNPIVFNQDLYTFTLDENEDGSSTRVDVGTVTATDGDSTSNPLAYTIEEGDISKFFINRQSGVISYIGSGEDYESETIQYNLTVRANDGKNTTTAKVVININNLDDNSLAFNQSSYTFSLDENEDGSSTAVPVDSVNAADIDDSSSTIAYTIKEGDTSKFAINRLSGAISYIGNGEDYESGVTSYELTVKASDWLNEVTANVIVNINNLNESPAFEKNIYTFTLDENLDGSSTPISIGNISATDPEDDSLTYHLVSEQVPFVVNPLNGNIQYIGSGEDHETKDEYNLTVRASDDINNATSNVLVIIFDSNEFSVVFVPNSSYVFTLNENEDGSVTPVFVGNVTATDKDSTSEIQYSIFIGDTNKFNINSSTGEITYIGEGEDYESGTIQYSLTIEASDNGNRGIAEVTINIIEIDGVLEFSDDSYTFTLNENADGSSNPVDVGTVSAGDSDSTEDITYSITKGDTDKFNIDSETGEITYVGDGEDYESGVTQYELTVKASVRTTEVTADVTININNLNDGSEFGFERSSYVFSLDENADGSTNPVNIGTVNAINNNGDITYSISSGDTNKFNINSSSGAITYTGSGEDYESQTKQYTLTVTASDDNDEITTDVTININNLNDVINEPPVARDDEIEIISGDTTSVLSNGKTSVRDNDEDEDNLNSQLTVTLINDASHGNLTLNENGTFTYMHYGNSTTDDSFRYSISDGINGSSATVTISVQEDTSPPTVNITSPANGSSTTDTTPEISFIAMDNTSPEAFKSLKFKVFVDNNTLVREEVGNSNTTISYNLSALSIGSHTFWVEATDPAGNSKNSSNVTININRATTSSSSSGGGGGGSSSGTRLDEGDPEEFRIRSGGSSVDLIEVEANERVNNVKIKAKKLTRLPSSVDETPSGQIYEYIDITASRLDDDEIADATIEFIVDKDWLSDNEFDKEDVVLLRYDEEDDEWEELDTEVIGESAIEVRYSADTSGFSTFAIVAIKKPKTETTQISVVTTQQPTPTKTEPVEKTPEPVETTPEPTPTPTKTTPTSTDTSSFNNLLIIIPLIVVTFVVLIIAVSIIIRKSLSRRSGVKIRKKIRPPVQSPTISLERSRSVPTPMSVQPPKRYVEQRIPRQRRTTPVPIIVLVAIGIILVLGVVYQIFSTESTEASPLEGISIGINSLVFFSLVVVLVLIFVLAFKIIKENSYEHPRRKIKQYMKPKPRPSPTLSSTLRARSGAKHYSSKTIPIISLMLGVLIILILAIGVYIISTASFNMFSAENMNTILFIFLIIVMIVIFGVGYKYKVFSELLFGKSNTQRSKLL